MSLPDNLKYTSQHEWVRVEGDTAIIGITDFAQSQLGDVVYVEFPEVGTEFKAEDAFGVVESVKAVSDVYSPVSGEVVDVNDALADDPEMINQDCYGEGWLVKIKLSDTTQLNSLLNPSAYQTLLDGETA